MNSSLNHRVLATAVLLLGFCLQLHAQNFVNLDFESATIAPLPSGQFNTVSVASGLPGWQVFYGTNSTPVSTMLHNANTAGSQNISIFGPNYSGYTIIGGQFMPFLQAGFAGMPGGLDTRSVTLEQSGLVPNSAHSLQFNVALFNQIGFGFDTNFSISLNGQTLSLVPIGVSATYASYGVDVTSFAGQVANLRFISFSTPQRPDNWVAVDSFQFSNVAVPEPGTWALLGLGALFCCAARRCRI